MWNHENVWVSNPSLCPFHQNCFYKRHFLGSPWMCVCKLSARSHKNMTCGNQQKASCAHKKTQQSKAFLFYPATPCDGHWCCLYRSVREGIHNILLKTSIFLVKVGAVDTIVKFSVGFLTSWAHFIIHCEAVHLNANVFFLLFCLLFTVCLWIFPAISRVSRLPAFNG